jgi:cell filamentation protein
MRARWFVGLALATSVADFLDPYLDPATGILRNLVGASTQAELDRREAGLSYARTVELVDHPVKLTGDLAQLQQIHARLFGDVYEFAGQPRTVDMRKGTDPKAEFFMPAVRLQRAAGFAFQELAGENFLRGLGREPFIARLAHHYDAVNYLHCFREGNGRAQRIFWSQLAEQAGFDLEWRNTSGRVNDRVSKDAMESQDLTGLKDMFRDVVRPGNAQADRLSQLDLPDAREIAEAAVTRPTTVRAPTTRQNASEAVTLASSDFPMPATAAVTQRSASMDRPSTGRRTPTQDRSKEVER